MFLKTLKVIAFIFCVSFIIMSFFARFVLKNLSLQDMILGDLFFGVCAIAFLVSLKFSSKSILVNRAKLMRWQIHILCFCGLLFGFYCIYILFFESYPLLIKIILLGGALFFVITPVTVWIILKIGNKGNKGE